MEIVVVIFSGEQSFARPFLGLSLWFKFSRKQNLMWNCCCHHLKNTVFCKTVFWPKSRVLFWPKRDADVEVVAFIIPKEQEFAKAI